MWHWIQRLVTGTDSAESVALAAAESRARIRRAHCPHDCVSCDYFHNVAHTTASISLLRNVEAVQGDHLRMCARPYIRPNP